MTRSNFVFALILAFFFLSSVVKMQSSRSEQVKVLLENGEDDLYEKETIYLNGSLNKYTKNGVKKKVGAFAKLLQKEFDSCSVEGKKEMIACTRNKKRGTAYLGAGGVVLIGSLIAAPVVAAPAFLGLVVAGLVPYSIGAAKIMRSQNQLQRAVWLHNRDILRKHRN